MLRRIFFSECYFCGFLCRCETHPRIQQLTSQSKVTSETLGSHTGPLWRRSIYSNLTTSFIKGLVGDETSTLHLIKLSFHPSGIYTILFMLRCLVTSDITNKHNCDFTVYSVTGFHLFSEGHTRELETLPKKHETFWTHLYIITLHMFSKLLLIHKGSFDSPLLVSCHAEHFVCICLIRTSGYTI